ncbi:uncharacterized protein LOC111411035 [Olea europaea subsp. europaea]|uniref:Uncharacterized protein LOC111411035 n=1 Tax=Olea europaea subsp. europaea TaxID=158383 RepID=A0A8S0P9C9_OLEEU|nr:uncharacterized protein LOC111411035 [Olea europaea subsp. europaea]
MTPNLNSTRSTNCKRTIKFLYSYGGKIVPRPIDGKLRYTGGFNRVLSVDRSIKFAELMLKLEESCGHSMKLKCKLPSEDLDVLVSITCDEDLKNVIGEYDRLSPETKITAVLFPIKPSKKISPPSSPMSCFDFPSAMRKPVPAATTCYHVPPTFRRFSPAVIYPATARKYNYYQERNPSRFYSAPSRKFSHSLQQ